MLKIGVIGVGNCGNQIALLAKKELNCDVFAINSSENDLGTLPSDIPRKLIGDEGEGTGKNRNNAKKLLKKSIVDMIQSQDFLTFATGKDAIFVASSTGGGSGSGISPILTAALKQALKNQDGTPKIIIMIGVLPKLAEGYSTQVNTLEYMDELYTVMKGQTYMLYDNNTRSKETSYKALTSINKEIVEDIRVLQCYYNKSTPYDSIDERDMKMLLSTPNRIAVFRLQDIKEKDLDGTDIEEQMIEQIKSSGHAELQRDGIIVRTGLITNLNERLNDQFDTHINKIRCFVGEPVEEFLHIAVNEERTLANNVFLLLTGLSKVSDRIEKIKDRVAEIDELQKEKEESIDDAGDISAEQIAEMNKKRQYQEVETEEGEMDLKGLFDLFNA